MLTKKQSGDNHVTGIPYCPHCASHFRNPITIYKLFFWLNGKLDQIIQLPKKPLGSFYSKPNYLATGNKYMKR
jgi:hypothetical protein